MLSEALRYVREGDVLRVHSIDRLARSLIDLERIVDDLTSRGVHVEFVDRGLTFAPGKEDPAGVLLRHVIAAVAEFERTMIRERSAKASRPRRHVRSTGGGAAHSTPSVSRRYVDEPRRGRGTLPSLRTTS